MAEKERTDFCIECRKKTEYFFQKKDIVRNIRGKDYTFGITVAVCADCGEEMSIPGLIDKSVQKIDEQYRVAEESIFTTCLVRHPNSCQHNYKRGTAPQAAPLSTCSKKNI